MKSGYKIRGKETIHATVEGCAADYTPGCKLIRVDVNGQEHNLTGKEIDSGAAAFLAATMRNRRKESRNAK